MEELMGFVLSLDQISFVEKIAFHMAVVENVC